MLRSFTSSRQELQKEEVRPHKPTQTKEEVKVKGLLFILIVIVDYK